MPVLSTLRRTQAGPAPPRSYPCQGCGRPHNTRQGLAHHYSSKAECRTQRDRKELQERLNSSDDDATDDDTRSDDRFNMGDPSRSDSDDDSDDSIPKPPRKRTRVTVEDDVDEPPVRDDVEISIEEHVLGGKTFGRGTFPMQELRDYQKKEGIPHTDPFPDDKEYQLYKWLLRAVPSLTEIDNGLKLDIMQERVQPTYGSKRATLKALETLPDGPAFVHRIIEVTGDVLDENGKPIPQVVEFWTRDPVECVRELLSNPAFKNDTVYKPRTVKRRCGGVEESVYDEMWTGDWWWNMQNDLPDDATIAPIILASDKTKLSYFSGDKAAWPVYLSIGNIAKDTRRTISKRATVLLGYLPATGLAECFDDKDNRNAKAHDVFHRCMTVMMEPVVEAAKNGVDMVCPDGFIRKVYPILAVYMADYPEQCMVTCCRQSGCPKCNVQEKRRGEQYHSELREQETTLRTIREYIEGRPGAKEAFEKLNLRNTWKPFWAKLPHTNIHACITPDILHQLHKGIFKDHLYAWCASILGPREMDKRYKAMPSHPAVRHFSKGISGIKQWSGKEYRQMEKSFLGVIAGADGITADLMTAARALLDFIMLAQLPSHTESALRDMDTALDDFHRCKTAFVKAGVRKHFNIPKIHSLVHYTAAIRSFGSPDGYNTELPERLHIDLAKSGYRHSNHNNYGPQMVTWLQRQERLWKLDAYIRWINPDARIFTAEEEREDKEFLHPDALLEEDPDHDEGPDEAVEVDPTWTPESLHDRISPFRIAKTAPFPHLASTVIETAFVAPDFLSCLHSFLRRELPPHGYVRPNAFDRFDVYKNVSFTIRPAIRGGHEIQDRIRAVPKRSDAAPSLQRLARSSEYFDMALAKLTTTSDYRPVRVRVIFKVPDSISPFYKHPLVYVNLLTEPKKSPEKSIKMYKVQYERNENQEIRSAVIRLDWIQRSCFLLPIFGGSAPVGWRTKKVLDLCSQFFMDDLLDIDSFVTL